MARPLDPRQGLHWTRALATLEGAISDIATDMEPEPREAIVSHACASTTRRSRGACTRPRGGARGPGPGALLLAVAGLALAGGPARAQADEALFIHGPGQPPMGFVQSGDQALVDRLAGLGFVVTVRQDTTVTPADAAGKALIVISETVASGSVVTSLGGQAALRALPSPILCFEPYLYDDLGMTGTAQSGTTPAPVPDNGGINNGEHGNLPAHDRVLVVDATHPLAAGLGPNGAVVQVAAQPVQMGFGVPNGNAQVVFRLDPAHPWPQNEAPNVPLAQRACLFVYEPGAVLVSGGPAAGRRVGFFARHAAALSLTAGWSVFEASAQHAAGTKTIRGGSAWSSPSAWTPPGLPAAGDAVLVTGGGTVAFDVASASVRSLTVNASTTLGLGGGALTVAQEAAVGPGAVAISGAGALAVGGAAVVRGQGTLSLGGGTLSVAGAVTVQPQGALTVSGGSATVSGALAVQGQGSLALGGGAVSATGAVTVQAQGLLAFTSGALRLGTAPCQIAGTLRAEGGGRIERAGAGEIDVRVTSGGRVELDGLTFRGGDTEGLHVQAGASIAWLRRCRFEQVGANAAARHLTIEQASLDLAAPGLHFEGPLTGNRRNVHLRDTNGGNDVRLDTEDRGPAVSGAGAGAARHTLQNGAWINWCWATPEGAAGRRVGYPCVAWDLDTFATYATYVPMRDVEGPGTVDRIHVFDPDGAGVQAPYWFDVPQAWGDLVDAPWWDTVGGQHVLWATTTGGRLVRWTDPGAGAGALAPDAGYPLTAGTITAFTSAPITDASKTLVHAVGRQGANGPRFYAVDVATGTLAWQLTLGAALSTQLAVGLQDGVVKAFVGSAPSGGRGNVYRVNTQARLVEATNRSLFGQVRACPFPIEGIGLFVGDSTGRVVRVDQASPTMAAASGWPVRPRGDALEGGVFLEFWVADPWVYWGSTAGYVFAYRVADAASQWGTNVRPAGNVAIRTAPLPDGAALWFTNTGGRLMAVSRANPGGALLADYRFGPAGTDACPLGDPAQEHSVGRVLVTTDNGKFRVVDRLP